MSFKFAVAVAALVVGALPAYSASVTNLVTNGDFDSASGGSGAQIAPGSGVQNLTGWTMGNRSGGSSSTPGLGFWYASGTGDSQSNPGSNIYLYGPGNTTPVANGLTANSGAVSVGGTNVGGNYVALDADTTVNGALSQTISGLTVGQDYTLSFYWATAELVDPTPGPTTEQIQASFGSQTRSTVTQSTATKGFDPWTQVTVLFNASSTSQTLSFLAVGSPSGFPPTVLLDAVSLVQTPEPSTWAIMLVGVGGLAGFTAMRRRSRGAGAAAA